MLPHRPGLPNPWPADHMWPTIVHVACPQELQYSTSEYFAFITNIIFKTANFQFWKWLFRLKRQNSVFPLFGLRFGLELGLRLGLGLEFGLALGLGLFWHLQQNSR